MKLTKQQQLEKAIEEVEIETSFGTENTAFTSREATISFLKNEWIDDPEVHEEVIKLLKEKHGIDVDEVKVEPIEFDSVKRALEKHARYSNNPASGKQINFLTSLFVQNQKDPKEWDLGHANFNMPLSKSKASHIIDCLK